MMIDDQMIFQMKTTFFEKHEKLFRFHQHEVNPYFLCRYFTRFAFSQSQRRGFHVEKIILFQGATFELKNTREYDYDTME